MEQLEFDMPVEESAPAAVSAAGADAPLAARLRPRTLDEYVGQLHVLGKGKLLRRCVDSDQFSSIILSGPPGVGKTSLAELIAKSTRSEFIRLSGVISTVADIRREIATAVARRRVNNRRTILFIDEIHRFNRAQQDVLLPDVENGVVRLIGATTENPNFYVVGPLMSRSLAFTLEPLSADDIKTLLLRAAADERGFPGKRVEIEPAALDFLAEVCEGDARRALNAFELAVLSSDENAGGAVAVSMETVRESVQKKMVSYGDDGHYDTASAFIKSMRGSDPDAAVYWLAKMLRAGEDIRFIARRIIIFASEDVGNADPRALSIAVDALRAVEMVGMPEARIILSQAVTYCATAPKSNAAYLAVDMAIEDVEKQRVVPVPSALRDPHSGAATAKGAQKGEYLYPHDHEGGFVAQEYLGVERQYYQPKKVGYEAKIAERMEYWRGIRESGKQEGK